MVYNNLDALQQPATFMIKVARGLYHSALKHYSTLSYIVSLMETISSVDAEFARRLPKIEVGSIRINFLPWKSIQRCSTILTVEKKPLTPSNSCTRTSVVA